MIFVFQLNSLTEKGSSLKHEVFFPRRIKNFEKLTLLDKVRRDCGSWFYSHQYMRW